MSPKPNRVVRSGRESRSEGVVHKSGLLANDGKEHQNRMIVLIVQLPIGKRFAARKGCVSYIGLRIPSRDNIRRVANACKQTTPIF